LDRYLLSKPKPQPEEGEEENQGEEEEKPPPLVENNLLRVYWENCAVPLIEHITNQMHPLHFIKLKNSYRSVGECL
jgi:hypothetical protein